MKLSGKSLAIAGILSLSLIGCVPPKLPPTLPGLNPQQNTPTAAATIGDTLPQICQMMQGNLVNAKDMYEKQWLAFSGTVEDIEKRAGYMVTLRSGKLTKRSLDRINNKTLITIFARTDNVSAIRNLTVGKAASGTGKISYLLLNQVGQCNIFLENVQF